ncbi:MAG: PfkB family carbohydrate kinase, partial [Thermodesulfobacteriota bacterium]
VTPNLMEASALAQLKVSNLEEMKRAAHRIYHFGPKYVLVKGGHLKGKAVDILYDGKRFTEMEAQRIESKNTHGTGCTFASAIATFLAKGEEVPEAVRKAKDFITLSIQSGFKIGKGNGPTNPTAYILKEMERYRVIQELKKAIEILKGQAIGYLIPEVSSNLGYALPFAQAVEEVAAFPGRIIRFKDSILTPGDPEFGASQHIARIILTLMKFDLEYRSAMNIRYSKENVVKFREKGFTVSHFDRRLEPRRIKEKEGSSLEWGVGEVLRKLKRVPDFIYDQGDVGKEPMIRVLGRDPMEVVNKILKAIGRKQ